MRAINLNKTIKTIRKFFFFSVITRGNECISIATLKFYGGRHVAQMGPIFGVLNGYMLEC